MKKLSRSVKVTGTLAGAAVRAGANKILKKDNRRASNAKHLREALGRLKGPVMKVAQLLATIPEALPPEYAAELALLQAQAPPMGWLFVKRRMTAELGPNWQSLFKSFEQTASAAASLGQVHKAVGWDGAMLACKLQYPDMKTVIDADLKQVKFLFQLFETFDQAVQTKQIHAELSERLKEELDYIQEARHISWYRAMLSHEKEIRVPEVYPKLSTDRLLTMSWLEGKPLLDFKTAPQSVRDELALKLFRAWYIPFYQYGIIHGDPHPGNYTIAPDQKLNLLDFGCVRVFPSRFVRGVIDLYHALQNDDRALAVHAYESWGFKNLSNELIDVLTIWARFLYSPILENKRRTIGEAKDGFYGRETAMEVHKNLKKLGGIEVPREFVFMDRSAIGLGSVFIHLQAKVNWHDLFHELITDFDERALARKQNKLIDK